MKFPTQTLFCIVSHSAKSVTVYQRKLNAIYDHVKFSQGDKVGYYEHNNIKSVYRKHKGYKVSYES